MALATMLSVGVSYGASVAVNPADTKQKVLGFGAGMAYYQNWVTALGNTTREAFYDTAFTGLNLSLLRMANWMQDPEYDLSNDAAIVKAARKRLGNRFKIEMSSWSAPGTLKPSGSLNGKDASSKAGKTLKTSSNDAYGKFVYKEFADWWVSAYNAYAELGIAPDYISLQNEPDMEADYEETLFEPSETTEIAGYSQALNAVSDAFKNVDNPPKIIGPEPLGIGYNNFQKYMNALDESKLGGYAYHLYHAGDGNDNSGQNYLNPENFSKAMSTIGSKYGSDEKPLIMTEFCTMEDNIRESDMVGLAHIIQVGFTSGNLNGYIAWELFWGEGKGQLIGVCTAGWGSCQEDQITIEPEYHAMRHYSKFVNPGSRVVASTSDDKDVKVVAFRSVACDSLTIVAINTSTSAKTMNAPAVGGYSAVSVAQSVENGNKSAVVPPSVSYDMPARSIMTFVYTNDGSTSLQCEDRPVEPSVGPGTGSEEIVIVDFANETSAGKWSTDIAATPNDITFETTPLGSVSKYVKVPLANCAQDDCGYQHAVFSLPAKAQAMDPLSTCRELVVTMQGIGGEVSVNIGGAGGSEWVNYQYGNTAPEGDWDEVRIPLDNESDSTGIAMGSNQLTFNSDNAGIYIAKIVARGCGSAVIANKGVRLNLSENAMVRVFDLNGVLVWAGAKSNAMDGNGAVRLNVPQGAYIVKSRNSTFKAVKK
ncbi:MAG: glycosyl hydrolase [Fibrobacter sp.]|nr:glycosyl hydrolase [Fibrobacter sp.]